MAFTNQLYSESIFRSTVEDLDKQRQDALNQINSDINQLKNTKVDAKLIKDALPNDLKALGTSKLPFLLLIVGNQVKQIIQPSLIELIEKYISDFNTCPADRRILDLIIIQRNNIVDSLNKIGKNIEVIGKSVSGVSTFLNSTLALINNINIASKAVSLASKVIPSPPGVPGVVVSGLSDLQTAIKDLTFDKLGNSKLSKLQGVINSSALVLSIIGTYILKAIEYLSLIDNYIKKCAPNSELEPISTEINSIAEAQKQALLTQNQITYQGFIIEIEEVPYTPTVNRRRAIGKNNQGIILIMTELSFTTDNQTLINELKFIIDRDNLKAY